MNIIKKAFKFAQALITRKKTDFIVLHHRAGDGDVDSIHAEHLKNGWAGIGYNLYIRKNGEVYQGRPLDKVGSHCPNYNSRSVGICFEGNFDKEKMGDVQYNAGVQAIKYVKSIYKNTKTIGHREVYATACPGKNFPLEKFKGV